MKIKKYLKQSRSESELVSLAIAYAWLDFLFLKQFILF